METTVSNLLRTLIVLECPRLHGKSGSYNANEQEVYDRIYGVSSEILRNNTYTMKDAIDLKALEQRMKRILDAGGKSQLFNRTLEFVKELTLYKFPSEPLIHVHFLLLASKHYKSSLDNLGSVQATAIQDAERKSNRIEWLKDQQASFSSKSLKHGELISGNITLDLGKHIEFQLLHDVILAIQSLDSKYIQHVESSNGFTVYHKLPISSSYRTIISKIAEIGWYCRGINRFIAEKTQSNRESLVMQSITFALRNELIDFSIAVSKWDDCLKSYEVGMTNGKAGDNDFIKISFRKLFILTRIWLKRLKFLLFMVDSIKDYSGGAILSVLHSFTYSGDKIQSELANRIVNIAYRPIYYIMYKFMTEGQLKDPFGEFFIMRNPHVPKGGFWEKKFEVRNSMLPSFISTEDAEKVLLAGKTLNFIKLIIMEVETSSDLSSRTINLPDLSDFKFSEENVIIENIRDHIDPIYMKTSKHLLEVFLNDLKFITHLKGIGNYLLLGQGDFIRYLLDLLKSKISNGNNGLLYHDITSILETSIRSTNAQFADPDSIKWLDCLLKDDLSRSNPLDSFILDYRVDGPLISVFTDDARQKYRKIFSFLWKIKRIDQSLVEAWKRMMMINKGLMFSRTKCHFFHQLCLQTSIVIHFFNQLQYYIMFEVLECQKQELDQKIQSALDLDMIIRAHNEYLKKICMLCFLDKKNEHVYNRINTIFEMMRQFDSIQDEFYMLMWDDQKLCVNAQPVDLKGPETKFEIFKTSFNRFFQEFLILVAQNSDFTIKSLGFRLNFNEFYEI